jgi:hypothetical protein
MAAWLFDKKLHCVAGQERKSEIEKLTACFDILDLFIDLLRTCFKHEFKVSVVKCNAY